VIQRQDHRSTSFSAHPLRAAQRHLLVRRMVFTTPVNFGSSTHGEYSFASDVVNICDSKLTLQ